jgi:hypothetical protein
MFGMEDKLQESGRRGCVVEGRANGSIGNGEAQVG